MTMLGNIESSGTEAADSRFFDAQPPEDAGVPLVEQIYALTPEQAKDCLDLELNGREHDYGQALLAFVQRRATDEQTTWVIAVESLKEVMHRPHDHAPEPL